MTTGNTIRTFEVFAGSTRTRQGGLTMRRPVMFLLAAACVLQPHVAPAQGLTGAFIGTVKDAQGGVLTGADGLVMAAEKRRSDGWQAFGSYTFSRASGLQASSASPPAAAQVSTIGPPNPLPFGRDPNALTNARGLLPNDRPHIIRLASSVDIPKTGF